MNWSGSLPPLVSSEQKEEDSIDSRIIWPLTRTAVVAGGECDGGN